MNGIEVSLKNAQKVKKHLLDTKNLSKEKKPLKKKESIVFPILSEEDLKNIFPDSKFVKEEFESVENINFKEELKKCLSEDELEHLKTSFDVLGDIAIIEVDDSLKEKEKIIAKYVLNQNKNLKTILKKSGIHKGEFRTQDLDYVLGENKKITIHKENNVILKLDVEKVYFSPRLSNERKRIASLVKKDENILVMFSGCAPYPVVLSKNTSAKKITAIELNPGGHKWAIENLKLNKINNIDLQNGDVRDIIPELKEKFDRILMPLPKSAEDFLDLALSVSKKGTIIHFYDFLEQKDIPNKAISKIDSACKNNNLKYDILNVTKCGQHAPYTFRICVDFKIL